MRYDVLTIFPDFFESPLNQTILKRAIARGLISVNVHDIRDYTLDKHRNVDDSPYGGGSGMVMAAQPIVAAAEDIRAKRGASESLKIILATPQGRPFEQKIARELAGFKNIMIICGRYEGIDERVIDILNPDEISIGDYVLSGGELPALVIIDAVSRYIPDVLGSETSVEMDTFSHGLLKYPQYTRPEEFMGLKAPSALLSGNHKEVERWRRRESLKRTLEKRPDLLEKIELSEEDKIIIKELKK
ncbi:MAG: tRNA (guanosine(37)-N1)-methyltransferase TrmD [Deltaproteobacteria bacterium]|nr:tRNA (guanosine(37)-N1)-methyltransferase TrmD [Deltaproteobacteria bacterium]